MVAFMVVKGEVEAFYIHADRLKKLAGSPGLAEWMQWTEDERDMKIEAAREKAGA